MNAIQSKSVRITEVGPRDGLQSQSAVVTTQDKARYVDLLSQSGVAEIEVGSFVNPNWVPQLADADEVFAAISRCDSVIYSALVPNERGLEGALNAGVDKIAVFTAASETFSQQNANASIDESLDRLAPVIARAADRRIPVRAYISCVVACPYEGSIDPRQVRGLAQRLLDLGANEVDLGETIGVAAPTDIDRLYQGLDGLLEPAQTTLHLHDTRGTALACAYRAMQLGVNSFDASCGGLGGCPYAPGAAGNLATEDLVYLCERMGIETGVNLEALLEASSHMAAALERPLPGRVFTADGAADSSTGSNS